MNAIDRDELEKFRGEFAAGMARMEGKLDAYIQTHQLIHQQDDSYLLPARVRALEDFRLEWSAYGRLLKFTFGASAIGAVSGLLGILLILRDLGMAG